MCGGHLSIRFLSAPVLGGALPDGNGLGSGAGTGGGGGSGGIGGPAHSTITISDSKQNFKDLCTPSSATTTLLGPGSMSLGGGIGGGGGCGITQQLTPNHLEIPSQGNPNLLSPDVLNQRRGLLSCSFFLFLGFALKPRFSFFFPFLCISFGACR